METRDYKQPTIKNYHHYLIFWAGQRLSYLGSEIVQFALIWWLTETSQSATILSIGMFITILPRVLLSSFAGVIADKFDRKKVVAIADGLQALTTLTLILLILIQNIAIWLVLSFNGIRAIFQTFHDPATNAVASTMVPKSKLSRINGMNQLVRSIIDMLCPIIAVLLMSFLPIHSILWVDIITFGIAITTLLMITIPKNPKVISEQLETEQSIKTSFKGELMEGIHAIESVKGLSAMFILVACTNLFLSPFNVLSTFFVNVIHGGNEVNMAILSVVFQVGLILGALVSSLKKEWKKKALVMVISVIAVFSGIIFMAFTPEGNFYWMSVGGFIVTFLLPMFQTLLVTIMQTTVPREKMGRIFGIFSTVNSATMLLGYVASGPLADLIGVVPLYIVSSLIAIGFVLLLYFFSNLRELDKLDLKSHKVEKSDDDAPVFVSSQILEDKPIESQ
ncbi:Enterobactin exporter EntS [Candidatus Lokiarchaeum ossiferum]|uniref:Enterobactin exporter EntS n=1 Tax=Candidatus Lokiarchaeum ossiferum TaxID=2951803 RepID=A0ABY6HUZ8_9ARCH|nr:Enterobactin exporter EntS [Candidatus Lokiarchaeum sp. B-35]